MSDPELSLAFAADDLRDFTLSCFSAVRGAVFMAATAQFWFLAVSHLACQNAMAVASSPEIGCFSVLLTQLAALPGNFWVVAVRNLARLLHLKRPFLRCSASIRFRTSC